MTENNKKNKYCFDTDTLVSSWRIHYRPDAFESLWDQLGDLVKNGAILIPDEVKKEIGVGKDGLVSWLKKYNVIGTPISMEQIEIVTEIVNKYPLVSQYKKPRPNHADPFVVAVAKIYKCTVVTYEKTNGNSKHPAIPDLCKEYRVDCCSMADFFKKEGWQFNVK